MAKLGVLARALSHAVEQDDREAMVSLLGLEEEDAEAVREVSQERLEALRLGWLYYVMTDPELRIEGPAISAGNPNIATLRIVDRQQSVVHTGRLILVEESEGDTVSHPAHIQPASGSPKTVRHIGD